MKRKHSLVLLGGVLELRNHSIADRFYGDNAEIACREINNRFNFNSRELKVGRANLQK